MKAGVLDKDGKYPDNTINGLIMKKLEEMNRINNGKKLLRKMESIIDDIKNKKK